MDSINKTSSGLNTDFDIMIVGGGPAGVSTWLHLHKYAPELAEKTVLIEKERYPRDKLCGGAILDLGQAILRKLNIQISVPNVSINKAIYRYCNEEYCHKVPNFLKIVRRLEFDYALAKEATNRGLMLNQNEEFIDYSSSNNGVIVKTNKGKYNVRVIVGADGALSKVRAKMKLQTKPRYATAIEIFNPVNQEYDPEFKENTTLMDFTPIKEGVQGYVWHFPCIKNGKPFMNHGICDVRIYKNRPRVNLKKIFSHELRSRQINFPPKKWSGHPIPWLEKQIHLSRSNMILVGDAAGIEPLIGGGIHLSLAYGDLAANAIVDAFQNSNYSFNDYNNRFMNHSVGKYINKLTLIAHEVYTGRSSILDSLRALLRK